MSNLQAARFLKPVDRLRVLGHPYKNILSYFTRLREKPQVRARLFPELEDKLPFKGIDYEFYLHDDGRATDIETGDEVFLWCPTSFRRHYKGAFDSRDDDW